MRRGVDLVDHLDRMSPKPLLTLHRPAVGGVGHETAERPDRSLVATDRRAATVPHRTKVGEPLISQSRAPQPRVRITISHERTHLTLTAVHRRRREVAGHLLVAPTRQHRLEDLI